MCSNLDGIETVKTKPVLSLEKLSTCKRCGLASFVCLQKKDVFCRSCFSQYCSHKFRATIGKSKLIKMKDTVLLAFSGGPSSVAMLDMVQDGLINPDAHRKLLFIPSLLFIREPNYSIKDSKFRRENEQKVKQMMIKSGLNCYLSSLEMMFSDQMTIHSALNKDDTIPSCPIGEKKLEKKLSEIDSLTAKEDFIRIMRQLLIQRIAEKENFRFIFSGESCTRTAILTLADIAQGKGSQIISQQAFCDDRFKVKVLRPMREFVAKEIAFWNLKRSNDYVDWLTLTTMKPVNSSLMKLTESYINGIEKDFPATVYTIFKTGNKLKYPDENVSKCDFCASKKDTVSDCSALYALELSHNLSKNIPYGESSTQLSDCLCYSCNILFSEMRTEKKSRKAITKEDISEFLL
ncbi:cytosolic thiouridylase subunit 2 [Brevipalpus obovatus]|uniref:cytosolic thiouridylase subunit 2 n=1 Tax=Brevipalpus obovatus TaxID=246614 RepID=UPI003D9E0DB1